jgi:hypothetical protein
LSNFERCSRCKQAEIGPHECVLDTDRQYMQKL